MAIYRIPVKLEWQGSPGGPGVNVWHCRVGSLGDPSNDALIGQVDGPLAALDDYYRDQLGNFGHGVVITVGDGITEISNPEAPRGVEVTAPTMAATSTTGMPPLLAICISWKTSLARRAGRGRTFLGPVSTSPADTNDGTLLDAALVDIKNRAQQLVDLSTSANGWAFGVYGKSQPGDALSGKVLRDFTGVSVSDKWAYLSSRRD